MCFKLIATLVLLIACESAGQYKSLNQMLAWKSLEYGFPSEKDRQSAIDKGLLTEHTGTPIDVGVQYMRDGHRRIFTTIPRFSQGIPYTLATISNKLGPNGPIIHPYPNYEAHNSNDSECKGITSAFRVAIDECNHMWVIDSGYVAGVQVCPPQLLVFDLNRDKQINRYQFTTDVYTPVTSLLITPVVDIRDPPPGGRCREAMVYIADVTNHGLVVYDSQRNTAWRIENKLLYPDPVWGTHTIAGESFVLMDGVFSLSLTPHRRGKGHSGERGLYFHALASETENFVPLRIIDNQTIWQTDHTAMEDAFQVIGKRGVQSEMEAMDSKGNLFANTHDPVHLFSWNIYHTPYSASSFKMVADDPEQLQFASGMKVVKNHHGHEELWVSTCRFQKISANTQDPTEINYRVLACRIDDLLDNRGCRDMGHPHIHHGNSLHGNRGHKRN